MSTSFRKQVYTQASSDHADLEGFLDDMERALRPMGIYCVNDPALDGSDMYGVIFHQGPIDPKKLWAWLHKQDPDTYPKRLTKARELSLTPSSLYKVGDRVVFKGPDRWLSDNAPCVVSRINYTVKYGWRYTVDLGTGEEYVKVMEDSLSTYIE